MAIREIVNRHGGDVEMYDGPGLQIIEPGHVDNRRAMLAELASAGGTVREGSRYRFTVVGGEPYHQLQWPRNAVSRERGAAHTTRLTVDFHQD